MARRAIPVVAAALLAALIVAVAPAGAANINRAVDDTVVIPDGGTGALAVDVATDGYVADVRVGVRIAHPATSQLRVVLVGPDGERAVLVSGRPAGAGGLDFGTGVGCGGALTSFSDAASATTAGSANPYAGTFRPAQPLDAFDNTDPNGQWRVEVTDSVAGTAGTIECVTLSITTIAALRVTTTADSVNAADGVVSLREAMLASRANGAEPDVIVLAAGARYAPTCRPTSGAGSIFEVGGGDHVTVDGSGATVAVACGLDLFRTLAAGSLDLTDVTLRADGASGLAVRGSTVGGTDLRIAGPFAGGVDATTMDARRLAVSGTSGVGVRTRGPATLLDVSLERNGTAGLRADAGMTVRGGSIAANGVGVLGAASIDQRTVVVDDVAIRDNVATGMEGPYLALTSSSVTGSVVGVRVPTATPAPSAVVERSTVSANGSGILVSAGGRLAVEDATVAANTTIDIGGTPSVFSSARSALGRCATPVTSSGGYNAAADPSCGVAGTGDRTGDLRLGPLVFASPGAAAPLPGSPLIDAIPVAACTSGNDQRGVVRPQGNACDIGSVEVRPVVPRSDSLITSVSTATVFPVTANDSDPDGQLPGAELRIRDVAGDGTATVEGSSLHFVAPPLAGLTAVIYDVCSLGGTVCRSATATIRIVDPPGYWLLERDGDVTAFGRATDLGGVGDVLGSAAAVAIAARPQSDGYWILSDDGRLHAIGAAAPLGNVDLAQLDKADEQVASLSATPSGNGLWAFTTAGRMIAFGDATPPAAMAGTGLLLTLTLDGPVVDSVATPSGGGAYMVAGDGGVFAVGDAEFVDSVRGALTAIHGPPGLPDLPVVGVVSDPDGRGYWMVASDGGVFSFAAPFRGSLPEVVPFDRLVAPVSGMVPYGNGYLLVAGDGGVFNFSGLRFDGSGAGLLDSPVVGIAAAAGSD